MACGERSGEIVAPSEKLSVEEIRKWKYQKYIKDYLATIKSVDDNIGRVLAYLKEHGLEKNTIVIYASDQGFYLCTTITMNIHSIIVFNHIME